MVKRAVKNGFVPNYVLCDSWYTSEELLLAMRSIKSGAMHVIAGVKNGKQRYGYNGQLFNPKEIIEQLSKLSKPHRCRSLGIIYRQAIVTYKEVGKVKLFMCRYPGQKKWRIFVTTNTELSFVETMRIYALRWSIEVLFRECKQFLGIGKCQSQDFDAQICSLTVGFMLYTFLSYLKRKDSYNTLGELFRLAQQDITEKHLAERLWAIFEELLELLLSVVNVSGKMTFKKLSKTKEYAYIKGVIESSFVFKQMGLLDYAA